MLQKSDLRSPAEVLEPGSRRAFRLRTVAGLFLLGAFAAGCAADRPLVYSQEKFDSDSRHSRSFGVPAAQTCEAAKRALLSNGYLVQRSNADLVDGLKRFQPTLDTHVEIEFHVVCVSEGRERSTAFVNALQDRFALKKTSNSASLGVGPVGSVSLPFGSSSDSLVKIASETIPSGDFYDRFFGLMEQFLAESAEDGGSAESTPPDVSTAQTPPTTR